MNTARRFLGLKLYALAITVCPEIRAALHKQIHACAEERVARALMLYHQRTVAQHARDN